MTATTAGTIQIGVLSKLTGLSIDTIRFYERQRLVQSPKRSDGNFRLFCEADADVLRFIKSAQDLGFSLDEVRELLTLRQDGAKACPKMANLLQLKLTSVRNKIASLRLLESELKSAVAKCEVALNGSPAIRTQICPVLDDISRKRRREARR